MIVEVHRLHRSSVSVCQIFMQRFHDCGSHTKLQAQNRHIIDSGGARSIGWDLDEHLVQDCLAIVYLNAARSLEFHLRMLQSVREQLPSMFWRRQESRRKAKLQGVDANCSFEHRDAIGIASKSGQGWAVWLRISPLKFHLKQELPQSRRARDHEWSQEIQEY